MMLTGWALYLSLFLLPFVQEDVAVITAATASITSLEPTVYIFSAILFGLTVSDIWKYWLGYAARRYQWAQKFASKKGVSVAGTLVRDELGKTLYVARFVPGTRVPTYIACGFFAVSYVKFVGLVILTAFTYVAISFALFHTVGAVAGEKAKYWLPVIVVTIIGSYLLLRWYRRRSNRLAPIAPVSDTLDCSMSDIAGGEAAPRQAAENAANMSDTVMPPQSEPKD